MLLQACTANERQANDITPMIDGTEAFQNHLACFPCQPYTHISACILDAQGHAQACDTLLPAHKADLDVALLSNPSGYYQNTLDCHLPSHVFQYWKGDSLVGTMQVSKACRSTRFQPHSKRFVGGAGFARLRLILEEMNLWGEN